MLPIVISTLLWLFLLLSLVIYYVQKTGEKYIVKNYLKLPNKVDAIIILGAGINEDGSPSKILEHRLDTAINLFNLGIYENILISGENKGKGYNEVGAMYKYLVRNSLLNDSNIIMDNNGISTYNSICRAKFDFKINRAIIVTNEFHLPRALYMANKLGVEVYGVSSDLGFYKDLDLYELREKFAQLKDFFKINVKFLLTSTKIK